jgi:hypothetical protein
MMVGIRAALDAVVPTPLSGAILADWIGIASIILLARSCSPLRHSH